MIKTVRFWPLVQIQKRNLALVKGYDKTGVSEYALDIDDSAVNRIKKLNRIDPLKYQHLRIIVEGGGCAGFQYAFSMVGAEAGNEEN